MFLPSAEVGSFERRVQHLLEVPLLHARGLEDALVEAQQRNHGAHVLEMLRGLEHGRAVLKAGLADESEPPEPGIGRVQLHAQVLLRPDGHADVGRRGRQAGADQLQVHHVIVVQRLDGIAHHVFDDVGMCAVGAQAPADLAAVLRVDDAAAAGLLADRAVGIPLSFINILDALLVADAQPRDLDVPEVLAHQVPFGALIHVHGPDFPDEGGTVPPQPDRDVDIGNARGEKGRRDRERRQQEEKA